METATELNEPLAQSIGPLVEPLLELRVSTDAIYDVIFRSNYPEELTLLYKNNPIIGKATCWNPLGDKISAIEKSCPDIISPDKYFTIRLDGKTFGSVVHALRSMGIFSKGYSVEFENIMITIARYAAEAFKGVLYVFTQSDELTILVDKIRVPEGIVGTAQNGYVHEHGGRRDKLETLSSSKVATKFLKEVIKLGLVKEVLGVNDIDRLPDISFDARIGTYDTLQEAFELILWRAYDCSVNGLSQAIYLCGIPGAKSNNTKNSNEKLRYLLENNLLPLSNHQAYGTIFRREYVDTKFINEKTKEEHIKRKRTYVQVSGPIIRNLKENLFPEVIEFPNVPSNIGGVSGDENVNGNKCC